MRDTLLSAGGRQRLKAALPPWLRPPYTPQTGPDGRPRYALPIRALRRLAGLAVGRIMPALTGYDSWLIVRQAERVRLYPAPTAEPPSFDVLTLTYNTPLAVLNQTAASVLEQDYPSWRWVVWDNGTQAPDTLARLKELAAHPQVTVHFSTENLGIARGHAAALALCQSEYVALLDHDDLLTTDALRVAAWHIARFGRPDFLYSDEDKCDPAGRRYWPMFKPDPSPAFLQSAAYICHLTVIRREALVAVEAFSDPAVEGAQDWDMTLRLFDAGLRVVHLPEVLYSWREVPGSTAGEGLGAKPYVVASQRHVLSQSLARRGLAERFEVRINPLFPSASGFWHLTRLARDPAPLVEVVLLARGRPALLERSLRSLLLDTDYPNFRVRLVDPGLTGRGAALAAAGDGETWASRLFLEEPRDWPLNLPRLLNRLAATPPAGAPAAELLAWLPPGAEVADRDWLWEAVGSLELNARAVMVGGRMVDRRGDLAGGAAVFGLGGGLQVAYQGESAELGGYFCCNIARRNTSALQGAPWVARREELLALGGFNPALPQHLHEAELGARAVAAGREVVYTPFMTARGRQTRPAPRDLAEEAQVLAREHPGFLRDDPHYSPFLSLDPARSYCLSNPAERRANLDQGCQAVGILAPRPTGDDACHCRYRGEQEYFGEKEDVGGRTLF
ncbi:MAG: glycosyltransferase [Deltaproteobacteria bacterium]|nr:glycosyltransferase [Deltaproteobacteria bacterium]